MGNICDIFSKNNNYDDDIIYINNKTNNKTNNKKLKEEIIPPEIEDDEPPSYNSINNNSINNNSINNNPSNPIPIVYDQKTQFIEYRRPIYVDNYQDNFTTGVLCGIMIEDIFNCD